MSERSPEPTGLTSLAPPYAGIEIWHIDLEMARTHRERVEKHLASDERERAEFFSQAKSGEQFILVRGLLREILAVCINASDVTTVTASSLRFSYGSFGKPFLAAHHDWQFNVTHSRNSALLVVAHNRVVGIDIQWCDPAFDTQKVVETAFSNYEKQLLLDKECEQERAMFFQIWTLKEAYTKANGHGLSINLREIDTSAAIKAPAFPMIWHREQGNWRSASRFELHSLKLPDYINKNYRAAIAIER